MSEADHFVRFEMLLESRSTATVIGETGFLLAINLAALFGNLLLCAVLRRSFTFQCIISILVAALSFTDFLLSVICMPLSIGVLIQGKWVYGDVACKVQCFFIYFLAFVSLQTMVLTSLNRYFRVVKPSTHNRFFTVKKTIAMMAFVWICTALIIAVPLISGAVTATFNPAKAACVMFKDLNDHKKYPAILIGLLLLIFAVIPTVVIFISYSKIFRLVGEHFTRVSPILHRNEENRRRVNIREIRTIRTLFVVVLVFVLTWSPVFVIEAMQALGFDWWRIPRQVQLMWTYFGSLSSAGNPLVYGFTNSSYRREYKRLFSSFWSRCNDRNELVGRSGSHSVVRTINLPS